MSTGYSYYESCLDIDIISKVKALLINGGYHLRESDGKISAKKHLGWETPWHHVRHSGDLDCGLWHKVIFDVISMALPADRRFVPSECQDCYKVVIRPKTLKQLFAVLDMQKAMSSPCKCGIETRPTVHGLYGGYWYNRGLSQGLERYKEVRALAGANRHLGPEVKVILKRACTEFEFACGPSDKWRITDEQIALEALVNRTFERDIINWVQPEWAIAYIHRKWIEWAYQNGDATYSDFTGGKPLYPEYVTYHHLSDGVELYE